MSGEESFYVTEKEDESYRATEYTRGPWSNEHQHGSPPVTLVGHLLQKQSKLNLTRLTVELIRAVPIGVLEVKIEKLRPGRMVEMYGARLYAKGKEVLRATGLFLKEEALDFEPPPLPGIEIPAPPGEGVAQHNFFKLERLGFDQSIDALFVKGGFGKGPESACWMKMNVPLIQGEEIEPLHRVLLVADTGNGISSYLEIGKYSFINPDLTIYFNRLPEGEYICSDAKTLTHTNGIAYSDATLFDEQGVLGRVNQSILVRKAPG